MVGTDEGIESENVAVALNRRKPSVAGFCRGARFGGFDPEDQKEKSATPLRRSRALDLLVELRGIEPLTS